MIQGINNINSVDYIYHYCLGVPVLSLTITPSSSLVGGTPSLLSPGMDLPATGRIFLLLISTDYRTVVEHIMEMMEDR